MRDGWLGLIERIAQLIWRRKTWPAIMLGAGVTCLVASSGGIDFLLRVASFGDGTDGVAEIRSADVPSYIQTTLLVIGSSLIGMAAIARLVHWRAERAQAAHAVLATIELRGLRLGNDAPLEKAKCLPRIVRRAPRVIDIRSRIRDGQVHDPTGALEEVDSRFRLMPGELVSRTNDDVSLVFGGLAPVPMTFLAGVHLDDESSAERLDWSRDREAWRALDGDDDGDRFVITEHAPTEGAGELVLCVSISYPVDVAAARAAFPDAASIEMRLTDLHVDNHWSRDKQRALAQEFLGVLTRNSHIRRVHLHLAAQASVAFLFGQRYDKRNLPPHLGLSVRTR